jgi:hypothetical protein
MDSIESGSNGRADLMTAVIEHLACYIQTGRPRSARLAILLLDRLARDGGTDDTLRERCHQLSEVLEGREEEPQVRPASSPHALRQSPWLTWEYLGEAA